MGGVRVPLISAFIVTVTSHLTHLPQAHHTTPHHESQLLQILNKDALIFSHSSLFFSFLQSFFLPHWKFGAFSISGLIHRSYSFFDRWRTSGNARGLFFSYLGERVLDLSPLSIADTLVATGSNADLSTNYPWSGAKLLRLDRKSWILRIVHYVLDPDWFVFVLCTIWIKIFFLSFYVSRFNK